MSFHAGICWCRFGGGLANGPTHHELQIKTCSAYVLCTGALWEISIVPSVHFSVSQSQPTHTSVFPWEPCLWVDLRTRHTPVSMSDHWCDSAARCTESDVRGHEKAKGEQAGDKCSWHTYIHTHGHTNFESSALLTHK